MKRRVLRCSNCNKPHKRKGQRYCLTCHNTYQRKWRAKRKREQAKLYRLLRSDFLAIAMPKSKVREAA